MDSLTFDPVDDSAPNKTWAQLLAENPQQKDGLKELASAEEEAVRRSSTAAQPTPSTKTTS